MRTGIPRVGDGQIVIEPMRRRHLRSVMRIEREAHPKPWSVGVFASELAQGDARYYVVLKVDGKVAGYGGLMFAADEAHVTNLAIGPAVRRQGLGTRVLCALASESTRRQCAAMTLEARMGNLAAQNLYRRFGFVSAGVRRNYYPETGEDALIMWLHGLQTTAVQARLTALGEGL
jgi:ribosomal-protein-alanine N-acetyltransferase